MAIGQTQPHDLACRHDGERVVIISESVATATVPVRFDGRVDGPAWAVADSITDFRQREPVEGSAASERTVVKVVRDVAALYISVRAYDHEPLRVRSSELRRDADLSSDDNVELLIDSFHDHRGAFVFGTNPRGAMWDAQLVDLDDLNQDWNGIWDVVVTRDDSGWTAEFRIPFRTLRFRGAADLRFGFNVRRFIRRKNEEDLWRSWGRAEGLYQLLNEGELQGLGGLRRPRDVEVYPYALTRAIEAEHDSTGALVANGFFGGKAGVDAKLTVSPTVTADLTAATDFAQVEVDQQVINLTRFPFFFPEKRAFFLESSGLFDFGTPGRVQVLYSRRVGLDSTGGVVPILAGGRVYGRTGPWRFGVLDARTGGADRANNAVVRVQRDLLARSYVGAIGSLRTVSGASPEAAGGVDLDLPLVIHGQNVEPKFWIAGTRTPGVAGFPLAWRLSTDNPNDLFDNFVSLYKIDTPTNRVHVFPGPRGSAILCSRDIAPPIPFERLRRQLGADALLINMVSSFDLALETLDQIRMAAREAATPIHLDVHNLTQGVNERQERFRRPLDTWRRWAFMIDTVQLNEDEVAGLDPSGAGEEKTVGHMLTLGVKGILITRGARGVSVYTDEHKHVARADIPAEPLPEGTDVTGGGDMFGAAFLFHYTRARQAAAAAGEAVRTVAVRLGGR